MTRDFVPPQLAELLARYLEQQTSAHGEGLGFAEPAGEVLPHEAVPAQPVEPRLAWDEALAALRCFQPAIETRSWQVPPEWSVLVAGHEPESALAFCAGNFPQLVRNLHALLQTDRLTEIRLPERRPVAVPALLEWATKQPYPRTLVAVGALRLANQFDTARELLAKDPTPGEWQQAWANERAALAWGEGKSAEALALWEGQPDSVPVHFNRGMAALFLGRSAQARVALSQAVAQLPESSAWHHLGRLYLGLTEMRG